MYQATPGASGPYQNHPDIAHDPLVPDSDSSDVDSAYGASICSSDSASLASEVLSYKYENGRRYHAFREGEYILPNDEDEQNRLDLLHHIFRMVLGGALYIAPLASEDQPLPRRILDLGCGTGLWCIDVADELPSATVIGTDLSPIQPTWVPANCSFYVDDIEAEWTYAPEEHFDYIHGRVLAGSIADWPKLFSQALQNLKPGGWIEVQEYSCQHYSDDSTAEQATYLIDWLHQLNNASVQNGKPLNIANRLKGYMQDAGFVDVSEEVYKVPIGPWAKGTKNKELGIYYRAQVLEAIEPYTLALYTRVLGYSLDQAQVVAARVRNDLNDPRLHTWVPFHFIRGRKPCHDS